MGNVFYNTYIHINKEHRYYKGNTEGNTSTWSDNKYTYLHKLFGKIKLL